MLSNKYFRIQIIHLSISVIALLNASCSGEHQETLVDEKIAECTSSANKDFGTMNRALLATHFESLDELQEIVDINYLKDSNLTDEHQKVSIRHCSRGVEINSVLASGKDEGDFKEANNGNFWNKLEIVIEAPYAVQNRASIQQIFLLARRKPDIFGQGDIAFYDLALACVNHIAAEDLIKFSEKDTTEKGFINTFNHITAQALVTSLFSEKTADFIADAHELHNMPELVTGKFKREQLTDPENNPIDNYVDIINNEWGQELGKTLSIKYKLDSQTRWTASLMANYLNDMQEYYSWSFNIRMRPFRESDEIVYRFAEKFNLVLHDDKPSS